MLRALSPLQERELHLLGLYEEGPREEDEELYAAGVVLPGGKRGEGPLSATVKWERNQRGIPGIPMGEVTVVLKSFPLDNVKFTGLFLVFLIFKHVGHYFLKFRFHLNFHNVPLKLP